MVGEAGVVAQAVGFVFATENTDAEFLEVLSGSAASKREKRRGCKKGLLQHGFVSWLTGVSPDVFGLKEMRP